MADDERKTASWWLTTFLSQATPKANSTVSQLISSSDFGRYAVAEWVKREVWLRGAFALTANALEKYEKTGDPNMDELSDNLRAVVMRIQEELETEAGNLTDAQKEEIRQGVALGVKAAKEEMESLSQRILSLPTDGRRSVMQWLSSAHYAEDQQDAIALLSSLKGKQLRIFGNLSLEEKNQWFSIFAPKRPKPSEALLTSRARLQNAAENYAERRALPEPESLFELIGKRTKESIRRKIGGAS